MHSLDRPGVQELSVAHDQEKVSNTSTITRTPPMPCPVTDLERTPRSCSGENVCEPQWANPSANCTRRLHTRSHLSRSATLQMCGTAHLTQQVTGVGAASRLQEFWRVAEMGLLTHRENLALLRR